MPKEQAPLLLNVYKAALALSTAMVEAEVKGANFDLVDKEWADLTEALLLAIEIA